MCVFFFLHHQHHLCHFLLLEFSNSLLEIIIVCILLYNLVCYVCVRNTFIRHLCAYCLIQYIQSKYRTSTVRKPGMVKWNVSIWILAFNYIKGMNFYPLGSCLFVSITHVPFSLSLLFLSHKTSSKILIKLFIKTHFSTEEHTRTQRRSEPLMSLCIIWAKLKTKIKPRIYLRVSQWYVHQIQFYFSASATVCRKSILIASKSLNLFYIS